MDGIKQLLASESSSALESSIQILDDEDDQDYIPRAGMTFNTLEDASTFYKEYAKRVGFSTKIRNINRCKETKEIKNQLITCNREGKWISEIPCVEKMNPTCGANYPARIAHSEENVTLVHFEGGSSLLTSVLPRSIPNVASA
ncbi:hypothetical protein PIB30_007422 [Stylosanthes scabra]|uniref:FAR1 domain-containing protein n=1 Tax=Stylosanthes scabra TaxID=79078 RepID=A0ABU6Q4L2_9FABA|nr:hypothetical protein [Stylosanthes scabra]